MSYNGSGTFVINSAGQPVVANTVISATVFNALTADLATGLSTAITKDGQTTITANIPFGGNKITGLGSGTAAADAANVGQVQTTAAKLITVSGTDTITGTMSPVLTSYTAGQLLYFVAAGANTGAVTINIDGLGAKAITRDGAVALASGDINADEVVVIVYDGTRFQMINAANSFGNTTINGTLTVTGNTGLQANVSITSTLSVGGTFAVTGASTFTGQINANGGVVGNVTGNVSGNAGTVTNGVYTTGNQTIGGTKTFSSTISGSITGNAGTVTDGVYTTGSYANPAWITSLAGSKITGNISGNAANVTGTVAVGNGGTGQTSYTDGQLLIGNSTGNTLTKATLTAGSGISVTNGNGSITIAATGGTGTVTSVNASGGTTGLSFSGGPVTTSGTLTLAGTLDVDNGGTGQTSYTDGQLLIGNSVGNTLTKATLTAGSGISITNGNGSITITSTGGGGSVTSVNVSGGTTGLSFSGGPVTTSGTITMAGTLAVANGGTGATTDSGARTNLGATTVGSNFFTLTNPSAIRFPRINADNTVSALSDTDFRTAIGAGTGNGTVTSVGGTGSVNGITLSGTVTSSGSLTLGGTLSGVSLSTQVTGTLPVANGGTGATDAATARTNLGASTVGGNFYTLTNPSAVTFPRINADNTVSALDAATFRSAIGAGTGSGSVTSVATGTGLTGGTITTTGTISLANTAVTAGSYGSASQVGTFTVDAQGRLTAASNTAISIANTAVSGLGTMSTQNANSVAITGGSVNGTTVGASTAASGAFTTLSASSTVTLSGGTANGVLYLDGSKNATSGSALVFDGSNLGLGVTPSAWYSTVRTLQLPNGSGIFGSTALSYTSVYANTFNNTGGDWKYITTDEASRYDQQNGQHQWYTAPSGTAGNTISFTQAMTLDASGNLSAGTTSIASSGQSNSITSGSVVAVKGPLNASTTSAGIFEFNSDKVAIRAYGATAGTGLIAFSTGGGGGSADTERARITAAGEFLIGLTSPSAGSNLEVRNSTNCLIRVTATSGLSGIDFGNTSDADLGRVRYDLSSNFLAFSTNKTEKARITSDGALVVNNSGSDAQIYLGGSSGTNRMYLARSGADSLLWNASNGAMRFGTNDTERARITSGGNLLLGTTSDPGYGRTTASIYDANGGILQVAGSATTALFYVYQPNNIAALSTTTNHPLGFFTNSTERARITSDGLVGIGTSSPSYKLDVSAANSGINITGSNSRLYFSGYRTLEGATDGTLLQIGEGYTSTSISGNVGVGTTSPASKLDVNGTIRDSAGNVRAIPQSGSDKTTSYTLATTDVGKFVGVGSGGSITIPNSTFATGDVVSIFNNTTGTITITCTITTAYIAGSDVDRASVTLDTRGIATILFISGTVCVINGNVTA